MPLYEYLCERCDERFELIQKFADRPLTTHEKCGGAVHRLLSASALQFKGSGWYVNDYAKSSKQESDGAPKKTDSEGASKTGDASPAASPSSESGGSGESSTNATEKKKATSSDTKSE